MGKSRRGDKEFTRERQLVKQNRQLKQEVSKLRKQLAKIDLDRYSTIKEMVEEHRMENKIENTKTLLESMKETWKCNECDSGYLEIVIFNKVGSPWYYRCCSSCSKRTKSQKYTPEVKGIVHG